MRIYLNCLRKEKFLVADRRNYLLQVVEITEIASLILENVYFVLSVMKVFMQRYFLSIVKRFVEKDHFHTCLLK